jgi:hypothetical protein
VKGESLTSTRILSTNEGASNLTGSCEPTYIRELRETLAGLITTGKSKRRWNICQDRRRAQSKSSERKEQIINS